MQAETSAAAVGHEHYRIADIRVHTHIEASNRRWILLFVAVLEEHFLPGS